MNRLPGLLLIAALGATSALAQPFYLAPDFPVHVGLDDLLPSEVVRNVGGFYTVFADLPDTAQIDAAYRLPGGEWLLSFASSTAIGGTAFDPRDIVLLDNSGVGTLVLDGAAAGIPPGANIDAVFLDDSANLIVSFDGPTSVGGQFFHPADLARCTAATCVMYLDLVAAGVPAHARVRAADSWSGGVVFSLDVGFRRGTLSVLPGDLLTYDGASLQPFYRFLTEPANWHANALSLVTEQGLAAPRLHVNPVPGTGELVIDWTTPCAQNNETYGIYEGSIGSFFSHVSIDCVDDGADFQEVITPGNGSHYYLVVASGTDMEGSYGPWQGGERPAGANACQPLQALGTCP